MSMVPVVVSTPTSSAATNEAGSKFYGKRTGRCFVCAESGHWQDSCPVARARRENRQVIVAGGHTVAPGESTSMPSGGYKISIDRSIRNVLENTINHVNVNNVNYRSISSKVGMSPEGEGKCNLQNVEQDNAVREGKVIKQQRLSPVGRLKDRVDQWIKYGASDFILDIIQDGYALPFVEGIRPEGKILNNNKSSLIYHDFVEEEIAKLLKRGCISESKVSPLVVNPLTVSVNDQGKCRLILDLRYINQYLVIPKFTLEDVAVAKQIFHKGDFLFTFDLQSAYHHLEIADDYKEYLGFSWELNSRKKWFVFNVLPFGLSTGLFIFTKLGRVLVRHWRSQGINIILYLDDGIGGAASLDRARIVSTQVKQDLENCGFLLSEEKCLWEPKQRAVWLGFEFDTTCGKLFVKCDRVKKLKQWIGKMLNQIQGVTYYSDSGRVGPLVRVRELAGIVGQIISMSNGIGNVAQLRTRSMQWCIETRAGWDSSVVNEEAFAELRFWQEQIDSLNGFAWEDTRLCTKVVYSDASSTGYGGYAVNTGPEICNGQWTAAESAMSSTWRELEAVRRMLIALQSSLAGHRVKWFTDNQNVVRIASLGSTKANLQEIAIGLNSVCVQNNIVLDVEWISRENNVVADGLSRILDVNDWGISQEVIDWLESKWGKFSVDRFATDYNAKCREFNSKFFVPGTGGVDAFSQEWQGHFNLLVLPPHLVLKTWLYLQMQEAEGVLIFPLWRSSAAWPFICPDGKHFHLAVQDWTDLPADSLVEGRTTNSLFFGECFKCRMLAVKLNFRRFRTAGLAGFCSAALGYCSECLS